MGKSNMIEYIEQSQVRDKAILQTVIYPDLEHDYYWSDDFSPAFYIALAKAGFITVGIEHQGVELLLPQIQRHYALLNHTKLHVSRHVKKLLQNKNYSFTLNQRFNDVIEGLKHSYEDCWMHSSYEKLLHELHEGCFEDFKLLSAEISDPLNNTLIAAEIGYVSNALYTGLTKFSLKEKAYQNYGTLQRVVLTQYLDQQGIHLSNLGHHEMQYKLDLGAIVYPREAFLKKCGFA